MTSPLVIDARNISKSYGKGSSTFHALKDVSCRWRQGKA